MLGLYDSKILNFWYNFLDGNTDLCIIDEQFFTILDKVSVKYSNFSELKKLIKTYYIKDYNSINVYIRKFYSDDIYDSKLINIGSFSIPNYDTVGIMKRNDNKNKRKNNNKNISIIVSNELVKFVVDEISNMNYSYEENTKGKVLKK